MLRLSLSASFFLVYFFSISAAAETGISDLDELVVTGSHTPIAIDEVGSSYTVITEAQIKKRQANLVADLLRDVPGFAVSYTGVVGSQIQIRVRGAEANQLLVLIDGIEANDIASADEFNFANLSTTNIERIEIIRGPQSALYGSDALAGVVNIITKKGSGPTTVNAYSEVGSFGTFHSGGGISGSGDRYHYNLQGSYLSTAGSNIAPQGDEDDAYDNATISFAIGGKPIDNLQLDFTGRHTETSNEFDDQDFIVTGFAIDADNKSDASRDYLKAQAKLGLFNNAWEHIVSAAITSSENDNFASAIETSSTQGKKYRLDYKTNLYLDTTTFVDASHVFTVGIDHEKELFTQRGAVSFFGNPNQKQTVKTTGLVAGYRLGLWQRLFLSGSLRHDNNSDFKNATTYRTTAAYKLLDWGTRFHGSYGTGIKRPTFGDRFGFTPTTFIGNPNLNPEKSTAWDIGVEQALWNGHANVGLTYFHSRLEDEINGFFFTGAGFTAVNVDGISKRQGVEITADARLTEQLKLSAAYTWLDATQAGTSGNQVIEIRRPRNTGSINLDYNFLQDRANANLNITHTGKQKDTNFATFSTVDLGSYTLVNLATSYRVMKNTTVYGKIENLLDKDYVNVFGFQTPGVSGSVGINVSFQP